MVLGKKVAIFDWEWGRNSDPRDRQKIPCPTIITLIGLYLPLCLYPRAVSPCFFLLLVDLLPVFNSSNILEQKMRIPHLLKLVYS